MSEALEALLANHKHHQDYDDYGGYKGSDLEQQNLVAIAMLQSALPPPQPAPVDEPMTLEQMTDAIEHLCVNREIAEILAANSADEYRAIAAKAQGVRDGCST